MARTARSLIRETANRTSNPSADNLPKVGDDGFKPETHHSSANPLGDLIDDTTYEILMSHGLLYEKGMRDYEIRKNYWEMRRQMASSEAIEQLRTAHPYLQYDTIRKIIYAKAN